MRVSRRVKILIGLAVALLAGWVAHGPLGRGAAFVDTLETGAKAGVARTEIKGISVQMNREPLARVAILSGTDDPFLRCGSASFMRGNRDCSMARRPSDVPGINDRVAAVPGMAGFRWEPQGRVVPLLAETLGLAALAWLVGLGLGWLIFRRRREREGYL
jgi:hypothetical protein